MDTATTVTRARSQLLKRERRYQSLLRTLIYHLGVGAVGMLMLYPVAWLVASSLKEQSEIWTNISSLIPASLQWDNYTRGWDGIGGISFAVFFKNSFIISSLSTLFAVTSSALIAYGFARISFRGKNFWFAIMLLTLMLPNQVLLIPQYIIFGKLEWINTFYPLLIPRLGGDVFFIFMIIQFIRGIPIDLDEAAVIDGASTFGNFYYVILPQLKPALITAALFSFYWTWEDFLAPLVFLTDPKMYTVSVALRTFADPASATDWGAIFAMLTLSLVPVFLLFVFFQQYIVEGIATTGLKG